MLNVPKTHLSDKAIIFIQDYSVYLAHCIKADLLKQEVSLYFESKTYDKIKNWEIEKIHQTHWYKKDLYDQFYFWTKSGYVGYIRQAAGLLMIYFTDREYNFNFCLGNQNPERIGVFFPASQKQTKGFSAQELCKLLNWKVLKDADESWN